MAVPVIPLYPTSHGRKFGKGIVCVQPATTLGGIREGEEEEDDDDLVSTPENYYCSLFDEWDTLCQLPEAVRAKAVALAQSGYFVSFSSLLKEEGIGNRTAHCLFEEIRSKRDSKRTITKQTSTSLPRIDESEMFDPCKFLSTLMEDTKLQLAVYVWKSDRNGFDDYLKSQKLMHDACDCEILWYHIGKRLERAHIPRFAISKDELKTKRRAKLARLRKCQSSGAFIRCRARAKSSPSSSCHASLKAKARELESSPRRNSTTTMAKTQTPTKTTTTTTTTKGSKNWFTKIKQSKLVSAMRFKFGHSEGGVNEEKDGLDVGTTGTSPRFSPLGCHDDQSKIVVVPLKAPAPMTWKSTPRDYFGTSPHCADHITQ